MNKYSKIFILLNSFFIYFFGEFDTILRVLIYMIVCDFITGIITASLNNTVNSEKCSKGIIKKCMILLMVSVSVQISRLFNNQIPIREVVISFYIANEGISLIENLGNFIPIPNKLKKIFEQLLEESEKEED